MRLGHGIFFVDWHLSHHAHFDDLHDTVVRHIAYSQPTKGEFHAWG